MSLFSNTAPEPTDAPQGPSSAPSRPSHARTREEVRANAQRLGPAEEARQVAEKLRERNADQARRQSESREPAPERQEEARAAAGPDDGEDSQEEAFEYLDDLIESLGVDAEAFMSLKSRLKVNGEDGETTLKEALANHQRTAALTQKEQALAAERNRYLAEQTETLSALKQQFEAAKQHARAVYATLDAEMRSPQIQMLRQTDAASYFAWEDLHNRLKASVDQQFNTIVANENAMAQQHRERLRAESLAYLRGRIPDFDTQERFEKIAKVFQSRGVPPQEAQSILDPRLLHLVSDYADLQARVAAYEKAEAEAKKLAKKTPPASVRVSAPKPKDASAKKQISAAMEAQAGLRGRQALQQAASAIKLVGRLPKR